MTQREKQLFGQPYFAGDAELKKLQDKSKLWMQQYNNNPTENDNARAALLQELLKDCGDHARINPPFYVDFGCNISVGENSIINLNCTFLDTNRITIGHHSLIAPDVKIYTAYHPTTPSERYTKDGCLITMASPVTIGDYVWIGGGTIILPGVTIGNSVIIGAGSVVTRDIPDNVIAVGNPCHITKAISKGEIL